MIIYIYRHIIIYIYMNYIYILCLKMFDVDMFMPFNLWVDRYQHGVVVCVYIDL